MPEPLVCEDSDLTRLMETVQETPGAQILYQDTVRRGGLLGFFAREVHRVAYVAAGDTAELSGPAGQAGAHRGSDYSELLAMADSVSDASEGRPAPWTSTGGDPIPPAETEISPFAALLAEADAEEADVNVGRHRSGEGTDFASILSRYTTTGDPAAEAGPTPALPMSTPAPMPSPAPMPTPAGLELTGDGLAGVTPINGGGAQARERLELLMQLRQVGVPVSVNPGTEVRGLYQALEEILDQLPEPVMLPTGPGQLLAIVGEAVPALRAARATAKLLRLPMDDIVVAGLDEDAASGLRRVNGRRQAARLRQEISDGDLPGIVVVAIDGAGADDTAHAWANDLLAALRPDQSWAVIDARWKPEDCHGVLQRLLPVQALVVHGAELSASPASVWDLELPLALLDDRRPSTFVWLSLLLRLVGPAPQRHRATA